MLFPLRFRPKQSYHERPRCFGAPRDHGRRSHAGCDLYAPIGTPVLAVADGTVLAVYDFYLTTWAVEVDHGAFIVRYGEVTRSIPSGVKPGHKVSRGQVVGHVGRLAGLNFSMLHFEMYSGAKTGPLTNRARKPFMRRADLIDPTRHLDAAVLDTGGSATFTGPFFSIYRSGSLQSMPWLFTLP